MRAELREQPVAFVPAWMKPEDSNDSSVKAESDDEEHDEQTAYLCWNGEIYQQIESPSSEQPTGNSNDSKEAFMYDIADTTVVANHLHAPFVSNDDEINLGGNNGEQYHIRDLPSSQASAPQHHIANVMSRLYNAEFAFCILTEHGVFYGRDLWGRRSLLLWRCPRNCGSFQVVSVAEDSPPAVTAATAAAAMPTTADESPTENSTTALEWTEVPPGMVHCILFSEPKETIPEVAYPKASFPISRLPKNSLIPPIPHQNVTLQSSTETISERLWRASLELEFCLRRAVTIRLDQSSHRRSTGVLFSGGVDSVVLAALAAEILSSQYRAEKEAILAAKAQSRHLQCPPVPILYLYNVSFGPNPEKSGDRKAALKSYHTLQEKYKNSSIGEEVRGDKDCSENDDNHRAGVHDNNITDDDCDIKIVFRDIVVEWKDICRTEPHIRTLLSPKSTVMDVNIATALWFASRGRVAGQEASNNTSIYDNRSPRVLLLGMGADELMGGYGRHRKAYERGGWEELQSELTMDQNRLWERNCGRDDRLCSDHGREARFPFLDAHVVKLLQETMANEDGLVCDFGLPPGVGDKRILRLVAERLGLEHASGLVKRAIQFGSRISHLSDKKRFGSRRKAKGSTKI
jgi:asparagine synthetase B (glutamine-hydrolysing)